MGCGSSAGIPKVEAKKGVFEAEMEYWWNNSGSKGLRECIMALDSEDKEKWATHMNGFLENSFKTLKHLEKGSDKHKNPVTKEKYVEIYKKVLAGRTNVPEDNLYKLKLEADAYLKKAVSSCKEPALKLLLSSFLKEKDTLVWSQGEFAPQTNTPQFLKTYVNAMLTNQAWTQAGDDYQMAYHGRQKEFLESGIFFIKPGVEYPLHYHEAMEAYYILSGSTRFVQMVEDENGKSKLLYIEKKAGEWHFNPPWIPHAIVTPHGEPHLALWFREGGVGEKTNNELGYKWIGDVDGMEMMTVDDRNAFEKFCQCCISGEVKRHNSDPNLIGSVGFKIGAKQGAVSNPDSDHYFRVLTPSQFELINDDPKILEELNKNLTPERQAILASTIKRLQFRNERTETQYF